MESLLSGFSVIVLIGTGGKGTGAGTMFPLAQMARAQHKLVIPIFVRPSFERHEVEKRRYDHALNVCGQFDAANIRLVRDSQRSRVRRYRSPTSIGRLGTDESSDCARAPRAAVRALRPLAGGSRQTCR